GLKLLPANQLLQACMLLDGAPAARRLHAAWPHEGTCPHAHFGLHPLSCSLQAMALSVICKPGRSLGAHQAGCTHGGSLS
ncbi:hypothetical protein Dimus_026334, partial [Dionaea muscipula]